MRKNVESKLLCARQFKVDSIIEKGLWEPHGSGQGELVGC